MLTENEKMIILDNESVSEGFLTTSWFPRLVWISFRAAQRICWRDRQYCVKIQNSSFKTTFSFSSTSKDAIVAIIKDLQNNKAASAKIPLNI